ncbi:pyridoxamine 5'-phosphate oxidase-related, FMN-binding protein [Syntrophobotulus glycolicus DSM 8271]|uniref:Pyridoxamine 5'-phosphate oxidase-related, FMN-binding protein n=1 Tax=Syntrophobotulus glycolicus (strain DSM 8271 / FlGlyR) TaxID=645991 RepID=F0T2W5_SYNGF|nr:pyridoxamine 5'-phosphate oxidase family protein [Syntrophobotulus glycolicus]ADY57602.1 pyridoxamine 5'-phosphate oxidase-related, FMN-binding protein [Syntrophobotulus glycolicus DSM 8271]
MKITRDMWEKIRRYYSEALKASMHCSIATVSNHGIPNVSPIGSLMLKDDYSGFFFDIFAGTLSKNIDLNNHVCILCVNTGKLFWLKSLYLNRFGKPSGLKLIGTAGNKREATEEEIESFRSYIKPLKSFKGYHTLWDNLQYVREVRFTDYYPVNTGKMTFDL